MFAGCVEGYMICDPGRPGRGNSGMKDMRDKVDGGASLDELAPCKGSRRDRKGEITQRPQRGQITDVSAFSACYPNLAEALGYRMYSEIRCRQAVFARFA